MLHNNKDFVGEYMYSDSTYDYSVVNSESNNHSFTRYFGSEPGDYESIPLGMLSASSIVNSPAWVLSLFKAWVVKHPECDFIDSIYFSVLKYSEELENSSKTEHSSMSLLEAKHFLYMFKSALIFGRQKNFFSDLSDEDVTRLSKKLKESAKDVRNGRQRKFFTSAEYISLDDVFDFITLQTKYFYEKYEKAKKDTLKFLYDEEEVIKAGWYDRKPDQKKLIEWANKAYAKADTDVWDVEFEQILFTHFLKNR